MLKDLEFQYHIYNFVETKRKMKKILVFAALAIMACNKPEDCDRMVQCHRITFDYLDCTPGDGHLDQVTSDTLIENVPSCQADDWVKSMKELDSPSVTLENYPHTTENGKLLDKLYPTQCGCE